VKAVEEASCGAREAGKAAFLLACRVPDTYTTRAAATFLTPSERCKPVTDSQSVLGCRKSHACPSRPRVHDVCECSSVQRFD